MRNKSMNMHEENNKKPQNGLSGSFIMSERVAMSIISLLLSFLSFSGGYFYGTKNTNSFPTNSDTEILTSPLHPKNI